MMLLQMWVTSKRKHFSWLKAVNKATSILVRQLRFSSYESMLSCSSGISHFSWALGRLCTEHSYLTPLLVWLLMSRLELWPGMRLLEEMARSRDSQGCWSDSSGLMGKNGWFKTRSRRSGVRVAATDSRSGFMVYKNKNNAIAASMITVSS